MNSQPPLGCLVCIGLVFLFLLGRAVVPKVSASLWPIRWTESDRAYMQRRIKECDKDLEEIQKDIKWRRDFNGLGDLIGNSDETWGDRFHSRLCYYQSLKDAFTESLERGVKVAPPERFRNSYGYEKSPDRRYFDER